MFIIVFPVWKDFLDKNDWKVFLQMIIAVWIASQGKQANRKSPRHKKNEFPEWFADCCK